MFIKPHKMIKRLLLDIDLASPGDLRKTMSLDELSDLPLVSTIFDRKFFCSIVLVYLKKVVKLLIYMYFGVICLTSVLPFRDGRPV